jgi:hypothetical protein
MDRRGFYEKVALRDKVELELGGKGKEVVIMDCGGGWRMRQVGEMVKHHILRTVKMEVERMVRDDPFTLGGQVREEDFEKFVPSDEELSSLLESTLRRIKIFRPSSLTELTITIQQLPNFHQLRSKDNEYLYLLIDNLSTFSYREKYQMEKHGHKFPPEAKPLPAGGAIFPKTSKSFRSLFHAISLSRSKLGFATVFATSASLHHPRTPLYLPLSANSLTPESLASVSTFKQATHLDAFLILHPNRQVKLTSKKLRQAMDMREDWNIGRQEREVIGEVKLGGEGAREDDRLFKFLIDEIGVADPCWDNEDAADGVEA